MELTQEEKRTLNIFSEILKNNIHPNTGRLDFHKVVFDDNSPKILLECMSKLEMADWFILGYVDDGKHFVSVKNRKTYKRNKFGRESKEIALAHAILYAIKEMG